MASLQAIETIIKDGSRAVLYSPSTLPDGVAKFPKELEAILNQQELKPDVKPDVKQELLGVILKQQRQIQKKPTQVRKRQATPTATAANNVDKLHRQLDAIMDAKTKLIEVITREQALEKQVQQDLLKTVIGDKKLTPKMQEEVLQSVFAEQKLEKGSLKNVLRELMKEQQPQTVDTDTNGASKNGKTGKTQRDEQEQEQAEEQRQSQGERKMKKRKRQVTPPSEIEKLLADISKVRHDLLEVVWKEKFAKQEVRQELFGVLGKEQELDESMQR